MKKCFKLPNSRQLTYFLWSHWFLNSKQGADIRWSKGAMPIWNVVQTLASDYASHTAPTRHSSERLTQCALSLLSSVTRRYTRHRCCLPGIPCAYLCHRNVTFERYLLNMWCNVDSAGRQNHSDVGLKYANIAPISYLFHRFVCTVLQWLWTLFVNIKYNDIISY